MWKGANCGNVKVSERASVRIWLLSPVLHRARSVRPGHGLDCAWLGAAECKGDWAPQ